MGDRSHSTRGVPRATTSITWNITGNTEPVRATREIALPAGRRRWVCITTELSSRGGKKVSYYYTTYPRAG